MPPDAPNSDFIQVPASKCVIVPIGLFTRLMEFYLQHKGSPVPSSLPTGVDPAFAAKAAAYANKLNLEAPHRFSATTDPHFIFDAEDAENDGTGNTEDRA